MNISPRTLAWKCSCWLLILFVGSLHSCREQFPHNNTRTIWQSSMRLGASNMTTETIWAEHHENYFNWRWEIIFERQPWETVTVRMRGVRPTWAQKGHLAFEATFESANLGRVDFVSDTEYDIYIRPDTCNPRHRFWFFFSIENTQENQRIIFNIVNISKSRNLLMNGLTPVVKSTSR